MAQRPAISVVLPFHGTHEEAERAVAALRAIARREGDELIVVDNSGDDVVPAADDVRVIGVRRRMRTGASARGARSSAILPVDTVPSRPSANVHA